MTYQIIRQSPTYCQITDGIIGSSFSRLPNAYGSAKDPDHYGNGGEAIYAAEIAEYNRLLNRYSRQS